MKPFTLTAISAASSLLASCSPSPSTADPQLQRHQVVEAQLPSDFADTTFDNRFFLLEKCSNREGIVLDGSLFRASGDGSAYTVATAVCNGRTILRLQITESAQTARVRPGSEDPEHGLIYHLVDFLSVGTLRPGEMLTRSPFCSTPNEKDRDIEWFGIYDTTKDYPYTWENGGILAAWVVNPKTLRFELAPQELLRSAICESETDDED